ncbi:MAG: GNAT family N-acetyltransferase [Oscillospiraceae bacterium]|nr:GNAT family N-acetyltransferase [Oscillospiraceae bacterium]
MEPRALLNALHAAERLKDATRHCYTSGGRHESVAEHSWRMTLMAYLVRDEFPELDMDKVIRMCLIHDLGECFTGDIPAFDKTREDERREEALLYAWVDSLPEPYRTEMRALYDEMEERKTGEAKLYKALDNFEAVIQHNESELSTWTENEYTLNLTYGEDKAAFSPYLQKLRRLMREDTERKLAEGKTGAIRLAEITPENWRENPAVAPSQRRWVSDCMRLLARAYAYREARSKAYLVCEGENPAGMVLYYDCEALDAYDFSQLYIDEHCQGRGLGEAAAREVLRRMKADGKYRAAVLCYIEGNEAARRLYEKLGFRPTGERDGDEIVMRLDW